MKELAAILRRMEAAGSGSLVLATLVAVEGSSYRRTGARALFSDGGERVGSVSGGCLEEDIRERAAAVAKTGRAELAVYDTTSENDLLWGTGAGCHGVVRVLLERLAPRPAWAGRLAENLRQNRPTDLAVVWQAADSGALGTALAADAAPAPGASVFRQTVLPAPTLAIFGAGDDAQPLARGAQELGWRVVVADPRPACATEARFPGAGALIAAPASELVARADPPSDALAVVMTHHYVHDLPVLRDLLPRPLAYLGLLGPRQRADRILSDLAAAGLSLTPSMRARLHAPVGLDLGADTSEEVALSILAEMRAALAGRDSRPLRERTRPIHG